MPNILIFVNHDRASRHNDLRETLTGMFHAEGGERLETMTHMSEGRLGIVNVVSISMYGSMIVPGVCRATSSARHCPSTQTPFAIC
jgi:hypothetical protein